MSAAPSEAEPRQLLAGPPPATAPGGPAPVPSGARSRPHIVAFDLIRLIIMVFVVGVHTLAFAGGAVTVALGAVTTVFHTSRELFLMLTALVLTYNYGRRDHLKWTRFWRRRFWLVLPAYVTWSAIYYAADGSGRGPFPSAFLHDLLTAGARYHLYFLLVSMQIYLLFPVFRWILRKTEGHHLWLLAAAFAYQIALTTSLAYGVGRTGPLSQWLNGAAQGYWVESYVLYVVAGAIAGWHFDQVCAFTRRHLGSGRRITLVAGVGVVAGVGTYLAEVYGFGATPASASAVFQPVVAVEAMTLGWALLAGGLLWGDRGAPHRKFFAAGSASSFGIYLAHPLVLQCLLAVAGASFLGAGGGLLGAVRRAPAGLEILALLGVAVPVIYALAWVFASAARRTPASLMLTGREYAPRKTAAAVTNVPGDGGRGGRTRRAGRGWRAGRAGEKARPRGGTMKRFLILATAFAVTLGLGVFAGTSILNAIDRPTSTVTYSMKVGNLTRSWLDISPTAALPKAAPIIVVLSGIAATASQEANRDNFLQYAKADKAELIYPVSVRESWNVGGCCGAAGTLGINDVSFLEKLVPRVDPGHKRPIYFVGYSNGGRMVYDLACTDPGLFDAMAVVKADPMPGCVVTKPQNVLVLSSLNDPWVPFKPGEKGKETPPATVQIARLRTDLGCPKKSVTAAHGDMTLTSWSSCTDGKRLAWAVYQIGGHNFPPPTAHSPSGSQIIWSFFTKTPLAPLPG